MGKEEEEEKKEKEEKRTRKEGKGKRMKRSNGVQQLGFNQKKQKLFQVFISERI